MKYSKIFQYAYIVFAILFLYDGVSKYMENGEIYYPSILLGLQTKYTLKLKKSKMVCLQRP